MTITNLDPTTPQLKLVRNLFEAYTTLDMYKAQPFLSKDFQFHTFPKIASLHDDGKEVYLERYGILLALLAKIDYTIHEVIESPGKVLLHVRPPSKFVTSSQISDSAGKRHGPRPLAIVDTPT